MHGFSDDLEKTLKEKGQHNNSITYSVKFLKNSHNWEIKVFACAS